MTTIVMPVTTAETVGKTTEVMVIVMVMGRSTEKIFMGKVNFETLNLDSLHYV
jgi:hypothetical protein